MRSAAASVWPWPAATGRHHADFGPPPSFESPLPRVTCERQPRSRPLRRRLLPVSHAQTNAHHCPHRHRDVVCRVCPAKPAVGQCPGDRLDAFSSPRGLALAGVPCGRHRGLVLAPKITLRPDARSTEFQKPNAEHRGGIHCGGPSERPESRDDQQGGDRADRVQRHADLHEIGETVAADAVDVGVGLVTDRCRKRR